MPAGDDALRDGIVEDLHREVGGTELSTLLTFDASGPGSYNLFSTTGTVEILSIYGVVETTLSADSGRFCLDIHDGTRSHAITLADGPAMRDVVAGSLIVKSGPATGVLVLADATGAVVIENSDFRHPRTSTILVAKPSADNFIRLTSTGTNTSGAVRWYVSWKPLSTDGLLEVV